MKKLLSLVLSLSVLLGCANFVFASEEINVVINDKKITFTEPPVMENDRILVPIRAIAEAIQFDVGWDQNTQKVTLENISTEVTLYIERSDIKKTLKHASDSYKEKNEVFTTDVPAKLINDRTYLPLRAISELFGAEVNWNDNTNTAEIVYNNTKGDIVTFKDKGIEHLVRFAITLGDVDVSNVDMKLLADFSFNDLKLYDGTIYSGMLENIQRLGVDETFNYSSKDIPLVASLEEINLFSNLNEIYARYHNITDISPLNYKTSWKSIDISGNPVYDFNVLNELEIEDYFGCGYYNFEIEYINTNNDAQSSKKEYDKFKDNLISTFNTMQNVINQNISQNMTRKEKIEKINEWIINNISYDTDNQYYLSHLDNFYGTEYDKITILESAVINKCAICQGFTVTFEMFCNMLNIPCIYISGSADNGIEIVLHAWNIVKLEDNNFYHIDTTWNRASNNYLLINDSKIAEDHTWNTQEGTDKYNFKATLPLFSYYTE